MKLDKDITFSEWESLSATEKLYIINNYWTPYKCQIGAFTKREIVYNFIKSTAVSGIQYGIRSFGWEVYLLFVIVENSGIRVPKEFSNISVNKGVIIEWIDNKHAKVKFGYGGTEIINLEEKIIIK